MTAGSTLSVVFRMENYSVISNTVNSTSVNVNLFSLSGECATIYRTSIVDNTIVSDRTGSAGQNAQAVLVSAPYYHQNIVDSTAISFREMILLQSRGQSTPMSVRTAE